ncbi:MULTISPECIES: selenium metabolism-associated LysR family transcriptional regulator [Desulfococcus]|jgi:DNA-binding transcriptional LysR family regulator|uniref:Transcriptional regulator, LysR family n=1 Tax=Desulfococcus multivorans DSM 2059 TaxID=1121405 RepID=S7V2P9_DESML|nr:selenium metabolism-associated LysR family transcriptional regulator [Desulfococcus multivorans]AOY57855.1 LysR: transcriptional regulator [Desulfococcus multivorans]AQV00235.1 LysR family transcriptional regulator [Desulfococcus multivorans]EPR38938.1 transcriptional regulator, LysR family [Desulfococcus multivorans DSM 2059]MDX9818214.1 selenium metabolism-associated LysR family transcriptional regulator [Desulfococcus multivorans]SJZ66927.1 transcriptional regulator, LysR family [Desulfo
MDLWQLNIFCKVIESESFSKAGNIVHLSQPTISSHIKDLEAHFECRLIDRLAKKAIPTKAGELLYEYARKLIALKEEAEAAMAAFHGNLKGRLVIGGSTIPGVYILPRMVGLFVETYPDVTTAIRIGDTEEIVADVAAGLLEVGVVGARTGLKQIHQEPLLADELCLIVPVDHPWAKRGEITLSMLKTAPFIIREAGSGTLKSIEKHLSQVSMSVAQLNIVAEMGSTAAVIQGIKGRIGISILSRIAVAEELAGGILAVVAVRGLSLKRHFYLTSHRRKTLSPLSLAFIEFLKGRITLWPDLSVD